ncbi:hypothetical protein BU15DRAFT_79866, partial [Melanogaster broomeanus]
AEQRVKEEKQRAKAHRGRTPKPSCPTPGRHPLHQQGSQRDHIKAASPTSPDGDHTTPEHVGDSDPERADPRVISLWQEEIEQLRQQRDEEAAARRKAEAEAERYRVDFEMRTKELQSSGEKAPRPQEPQMHIGSPNIEAGPSSSGHTTPKRLGVGAADLQRVILQLLEQLRQQQDDEARKLEMKFNELQRTTDESHRPLEPQKNTGSPNMEAGPSSLHPKPSRSTSKAGPSTSQAGPFLSSGNTAGKSIQPRSS